jgi:hypothetical protein
MTSRGSSTRPPGAAADALAPDVPAQRALRPEPPVRSLAELVAFLAEVEAVVGRDERPRRPTTGDRFLL